jgi:putative tryptophan/tyrosine transport system substrate-binding protein
MHRRCAVLIVVACLLAVLAAIPATAADARRVGWLSTAQPSPALAAYREALRQGLVGHVNLQQLVLEERHAGPRADLLSTYASELVQLKVAAILAIGHDAARGAMQATSTIPIVIIASDVVAGGLVKTLEEPGGNVTGVAFDSAELGHRRLQILRSLAPKASVVAVLRQRGSAASDAEVQGLTTIAQSLGITARPIEAGDVRVLIRTVTEATEKIDAMLVPAEPWLMGEARRVVDLSAKLRLPTVYPFGEFADEGGLVAYGPNLRAMYRRAGSYVARVLTGARPRELPIERPSRSELVVNVRTARTLGVTVPASLLGAADRIVE